MLVDRFAVFCETDERWESANVIFGRQLLLLFRIDVHRNKIFQRRHRFVGRINICNHGFAGATPGRREHRHNRFARFSRRFTRFFKIGKPIFGQAMPALRMLWRDLCENFLVRTDSFRELRIGNRAIVVRVQHFCELRQLFFIDLSHSPRRVRLEFF